MMKSPVKLYIRVRLPDDSYRYLRPAFGRNGRIRPHHAIYDGRAIPCPGSTYNLRYRVGKRWVWETIGDDPSVVMDRLREKAFEFEAAALGKAELPTAPSPKPSSPLVAECIADFIEETTLTKKKKTVYAYTLATEYFAESFKKKHMNEIERIDMLRFAAFLRDEKELSPRTCRNVFGNVMTFLKAKDVTGIVKKGDWPRFVLEEPEIYEKDDLQKLYAVCDAKERLAWDFFLMTGMREQEVTHATWSDVNLTQGTVRVSWKADLGWTPKAYKERTIPIPSSLQSALKEALREKKSANSKCPLLFPTAGCKPKLNFLDDLKAAAKRADLDPDQFWLHKFRATFATWHLWEGVDLRTVQDWLSHSDMESTLRYLKPSRGQAVRAKVDATFSGMFPFSASTQENTVEAR
jgi:integrase